MSTSSCRVSVVIDCNWEHLMELKDVQKLAKQIQYAYTTNRRLAEPLQFIVTSLREGSMLKEKLDKDYAGYKNWDVYFKVSFVFFFHFIRDDTPSIKLDTHDPLRKFQRRRMTTTNASKRKK